MGDRANVCVQERGERVYLYTHWGAEGLIDAVRDAIKLGWRWDDGQYLARIVFQACLPDTLSEAGWGISAVVGDGADRVLVLDADTQTVWVEDTLDGMPSTRHMSFKDFAGLEGHVTWQFMRG